MKNKYWAINAKSENEAEILLYELIGDSAFNDGISSKRFSEELKALGNIEKITLRINSPGGDVFEGNAIYNILKGHQAYIEVHVDGIAASIASVIAMSGDTIIMPENGIIMIHDPWTYAIGRAEDMRKTADSLDIVKGSIVKTYKTKTRLPENEIKKLMSDETWFNANEAVEKGFADHVTEPIKAAARFDLSMFENIPYRIKQTFDKNQNVVTSINSRKRQLSILEDEIKNYSKNNNKIKKHKLNRAEATERSIQLARLDSELKKVVSYPNQSNRLNEKINTSRRKLITLPARKI